MKPAELSIDVCVMPQPRRIRGCDRARKTAMLNVIVNLREALARRRQPLLLSTLLALCLFACPRAFAGDTTSQQTFDSPQAAVKALETAAEANDMNALRTRF